MFSRVYIERCFSFVIGNIPRQRKLIFATGYLQIFTRYKLTIVSSPNCQLTLRQLYIVKYYSYIDHFLDSITLSRY